MLQEVFLFSGTIEGNIRLGREDITEERVRWAAQEVHADGFIQRLKEDYQAEVRERGAGYQWVRNNSSRLRARSLSIRRS